MEPFKPLHEPLPAQEGTDWLTDVPAPQPSLTNSEAAQKDREDSKEIAENYSLFYQSLEICKTKFELLGKREGAEVALKFYKCISKLNTTSDFVSALSTFGQYDKQAFKGKHKIPKTTRGMRKQVSRKRGRPSKADQDSSAQSYVKKIKLNEPFSGVKPQGRPTTVNIHSLKEKVYENKP